jgi:hypothetical protein
MQPSLCVPWRQCTAHNDSRPYQKAVIFEYRSPVTLSHEDRSFSVHLRGVHGGGDGHGPWRVKAAGIGFSVPSRQERSTTHIRWLDRAR